MKLVAGMFVVAVLLSGIAAATLWAQTAESRKPIVTSTQAQSGIKLYNRNLGGTIK